MDNIEVYRKMETKDVVSLAVHVAIPLLVGSIASYLTRDTMMIFRELKKPALTPPAVVFPIAWTILYIMMGISTFIAIWNKHKSTTLFYGLFFYRISLILNFMWSIIFFGARLYTAAFICLLLLWISVAVTMYYYNKASKVSSTLLIPYIMWLTFAGYLNMSIIMIN